MGFSPKYDIRERQAGKTYDLITRSAETKYPIVCKDGSTRSYLQQQAKERGLTIPDPIPIRTLLKDALRGIRPQKVLIDDADCILQTIVSDKISPACTIDTIAMVKRNELGHELTKDGEDLNVKYGLED